MSQTSVKRRNKSSSTVIKTIYKHRTNYSIQVEYPNKYYSQSPNNTDEDNPLTQQRNNIQNPHRYHNDKYHLG